MKFSFFLLLFFTRLAVNTFSQTDDNISTIRKGGGSDAELYFKITGDESTDFVNQLFNTYSKVRSHSYIHHFRQITVPGITDALTLRVHEGVAGHAPEGYAYFNTFTSKRYRKERLDCMTEKEVFGVLIYVKTSHRNTINTHEEAQAFVNYIRQIIST